MNQPANYNVIIKPQTGLSLFNLRELWEFRELIYHLIWRDIMVRYKQTLLGFTWAFLNPIINMIIFTLIFGGLAGLDSEGTPYQIFNYAALLPWLYFSSAVTRASSSLVGSANLIKKIYFPRAILPISSVLGGLPDFFIALLVMFGLMFFYGTPIYALRLLMIVPLLALTSMTAIGIGFWFSALNVRYRDVTHLVTYAVRFMLYATPVTYSLLEISNRLNETLYSLYVLNPIVGIIEGFRWVFLDRGTFDPLVLGAMIIVPIALFISGSIYFHSQERYFADYA